MHVTVIMSVYNGASLVKDAIQNLMGQTYADWDLLVVDDGSTDHTFDVIQSLALQNSRLSIVRNERNMGLAYALNRAISLAHGELIARADVDDLNMPSRLEKQATFMMEHPEIDVLGSGAEMIEESGKSLGIAYRPTTHEEIVMRMYREAPFFHSAIMARKHFYEKALGYDERIRYSQDADLWFRTYKVARFHNLPEPLISYRVRQRPSFVRTIWATYVICLGAYRDGCLLTKGWYAGRYALSASMGMLGLHNHRPK